MGRWNTFISSLSVLVIILSLIMVLPCNVMADDPVVTFPDVNLDAAIRVAISKPVGDIHASDLAGLTSFTAKVKGIINLTGMEYCTNLTDLDLGANRIINLAPLAGLNSLTNLDLTSNQISNLAPLVSLTSLTMLSLGFNQISNLAPLAGLTNLTYLYLQNNQINDLTPLVTLTNLTYLHINYNQISNLTALAGLTNLTYLFLSDNQISDITPLVNNPGLTTGDSIHLISNPLSFTSVNIQIPALRARGVIVSWITPPAPSSPPGMTSTGWYWPSGSTVRRVGSYIGVCFLNPAAPQFGFGNPLWHIAQDFPNPAGNPVYAIADGEVVMMGTDIGGYGYPPGTPGGALVARHQTSGGDYFTALYGHLDSPHPLGTISAGEIIGYSIFSGFTDGGDPRSHVHFGIHPGFAPLFAYLGYTENINNPFGYVDPINFLQMNMPLGSVYTSTGTGVALFTTNSGSITGLTAVSESALPTPGKPTGVTFPQGFYSFNITGIPVGSTVTVTITFPNNMATNTQFWGQANGRWINLTPFMGDNDGDRVLTLTLTDGGSSDADGLANGTIVDPTGPATPISAPRAPSTSSSESPYIPERLVSAPAKLTVKYLNALPQQAQANQPVTIYANIANGGDEAGNYTVALKVNGMIEATRTGKVGGHAAVPLKFEVIKDKPGIYSVDINGQQANFIIVDDGGAKRSLPTRPWAVIGFFLSAIGIIVVLGLLLRRRITDY